ncbi:MAG: aldehyde ferredoxin oxidoreductase [Deltaproteobacteria bacterium]|nr:aldehyde ferredoxin oxidoreductase [Deltaproteobacteria bacterium]MBW2361257.1 aldehyde ferredoxin oxidoreductase [Deltaproteobacteria bacterium]
MAVSPVQLLRVDMSRMSVESEPLPEAWTLLGGRALSSRILLEECDATCDPLGPENLLIFAGGVLGGTAAPTSGRLSVGAKSPLTGGIKEANAGGNPAQHLARLGYRAIVVSGQPADPDARFGLEVDEQGARLVAADELKGLWTYATCERLAELYSKQASFICCGPAGELRLGGASVACTDQESRHPTRHAGRGGMGAVMGAKGLKFVAVEPGKTRLRRAAQHEEFLALGKKFGRAYRDGPQPFAKGTVVGVQFANVIHSLPTRNRIAGQSSHVDTLDGNLIYESLAERGGGMHNCLTGCVVQCSNVVHDAEGNYKTSALEFETLALLGANCDVEHWDDVADLDRLCDELGLDTIETGAAIAILMEAGRMKWGDVDSMKALFYEIAEGSELGRAIGGGAVATGRYTGHHRVPAVKGQAIPAWDPRPLKATGATYATSAMGADHTAGLLLETGMPVEDCAQHSQEKQIVNAICDGSGFCEFIGPTPDDIRIFYGFMIGREVSREEIADLGWQVLEDEWEFNRRAGFTVADDVLPECMLTDPVGPASDVFDLPAEVLADVKVRKPLRPELFSIKAAG